MQKEVNFKQINRFRATAAIVFTVALLLASNPAFARLDELLVHDAPYINPPAVTEAASMDYYAVKEGDTLWDIARRNGVTIDVLASVNELSDQNHIRAGQVLKVPSDCTVHRVQQGETVSDIARMYRVDIESIAARNGLANVDSIIIGQQLYIPLGSRPESMPGPRPSRGFEMIAFSWPLTGNITSPFGIRDGRPHEGIDIAAYEGTPIRASAPGRVVFAGPRGTYGLTVIVDHGGGWRTLYAHCSKLLVTEGSMVDQATVIALAGSTGRSFGPHLHLEILRDGRPLDPLSFLEQERYYG